MTDREILKHVDHTLLKATAQWEDIKKLCEEALEYQTASVCVPPSYVKQIKKEFGSSPVICTVIGFPLGYNTTEIKAAEAAQALCDGADEIDMVVNLTDVKNKDTDRVTEEIKKIREAVGTHILKVIIETCYLTDDEKRILCKCVTDGGADYIKTSTGFGTKGADIEDIKLMKKYIGPAVKIKAAGGIRTREDMENFLAAGCDRLGTSSALKILNP